MRLILIFIFLLTGCSYLDKPRPPKVVKAKDFNKTVRKKSCYIPNTLLIKRKPVKLIPPEKFKELDREYKVKYISAVLVANTKKLKKANVQIEEISKILKEYNNK